MTDILGGFILILVGVSLSATYFTWTNKADPANKGPTEALTEVINRLTKRVEELEKAKASAITNVEISDSIKLVEGHFLALDKQVIALNEKYLDLKTHVSELSPVHRHYYKEVKEKPKKPLLPKEHPESIPQYRVGV